ncbi:MAG: endonuclease III [Nitrospirota bacterium]|nr:endonuclease III [Nitrospirota bacterium]
MTTRVLIADVMKNKIRLVQTLLEKNRIPPPGIEQLDISGNPYQVLISTILSLRTRDKVMEEASRKLFSLAPDIESLALLQEEKILESIYPVGFYRTKARTIKQIAKIIQERWDGLIPSRLDSLLELPGVGLKTANLVLSAGFGKSALCVDTHVHRISNRWGAIRTKSPDETYRILDDSLPDAVKSTVNPLLVSFGQSICLPVSPKCSQCSLSESCERVGVKTSR